MICHWRPCPTLSPPPPLCVAPAGAGPGGVSLLPAPPIHQVPREPEGPCLLSLLGWCRVQGWQATTPASFILVKGDWPSGACTPYAYLRASPLQVVETARSLKTHVLCCCLLVDGLLYTLKTLSTELGFVFLYNPLV